MEAARILDAPLAAPWKQSQASVGLDAEPLDRRSWRSTPKFTGMRGMTATSGGERWRTRGSAGPTEQRECERWPSRSSAVSKTAHGCRPALDAEPGVDVGQVVVDGSLGHRRPAGRSAGW